MTSAPARFARLLMLALVLSLGLIRPAYADDPGILRDTETEALFRDMAKPLIVAAGLDQQHMLGRIGAEPVRQQAAGRAAAADDVVVGRIAHG